MAFVIARFVGQRYACTRTGISLANAQRATEQRFTSREYSPTGRSHRYSRGHIEILNLEGLQDASEGCMSGAFDVRMELRSQIRVGGVFCERS
jgi:hypothetical protein